METAKHIIIVLVISLLATGVAISEESQISNTRQASCIVQVIIDEDTLLMNTEDIDGLVHSSAVLGKAVNEVLGHAPDNVIKNLRISGRRTGNKQITYNFNLDVKLPDAVKPTANEFIKALIKNLRTSIDNASFIYKKEMDDQLKAAQYQYKEAESQLEDALKGLESKQSQKYVITYSDLSEADKKIYEQLEKTVNLPNLSPDMTFAQVLEEMADSVEPPLQIQPNWRDLADMADIMPTTPAELEPLTSVKLGKALGILLDGISSDFADVGYAVRGGIIVIATEDTLPGKFVTMVYDISGLIGPSQSISSIKSAIQKTVEPDSWYDIDDIGEGKIEIIIGNQLSIYQTPEIQQKIQRFLDSIPIEAAPEPVINVSIASLNNDKQDMSNKKRMLEIDVARLKARQKAIEERIRTIGSQSTSKIKDDPVIKELEQIIDHQTQRLEGFKMLVERGQGTRTGLFDEEDKLSRLKIELAQRREELAKTAGGEQLTILNNDLSNVTIDLAGKEAELNEIERQLSSIESQIKAASTIDPVVLKIRQAKKALEEAENRVNDLKAKEANLQPPQVIAIGIE